jgi:hypothetical protein
MDTAIIQKRLNALSKAMLAKGLIAPDATYHLKSNADADVSLTHRKADGRWGHDRDYLYFKSLDEADAAIAAMPDKASRNLTEFLSLVAKAADYGNEVGIDAELVNPLVAAMKQISENALTYQGAA